MSDPERIEAAMTGMNVDPEDLTTAAEWVDTLSRQWDKDIVSYIDKTIGPLLSKSGEAQAAVVTANPHGHFDQATNLHDDVSDAHNALRTRAAGIGDLLRQLAQGTDTIAHSYTNVDQLNAADQHKLTSTLDASMTAKTSADPTGDV